MWVALEKLGKRLYIEIVGEGINILSRGRGRGRKTWKVEVTVEKDTGGTVDLCPKRLTFISYMGMNITLLRL